MNKQAGGIMDSAAFLGTLIALGISVPSFGAGWVLGKVTAPRDTDMNNLLKAYRLQRLHNDKNLLLVRQQQLAASANLPKSKSVYGLVNA